MRRRYSCGGYASSTGHCGSPDCDTCYPGGGEEGEGAEEHTFTTKTVTARKARKGSRLTPEIRPGDRVRVTSGFTFEPNGGPRTGYFRSYRRVSKGPAWEASA